MSAQSDRLCFRARKRVMQKLVIVLTGITLVTLFLCLPASQAQADSKAKAIEKYLTENFGTPGYKTTWYDSIKGISVQGNTVIANTNLLTGDAQASDVCFGVSGYVFSSQNRSLGLENVEVRGIKGNALMRRIGFRGKCSRTADHIRREQTPTQQ